MNASLAQLADHVLALPIGDRALLAQKLWESLDVPPSGHSAEDLKLAKERDAELREGRVIGIAHDDVMKAAREAIT